MENVISPISIVLALLFLAVLVFIGYCIRSVNETIDRDHKKRDRRLHEGKSTDFLDRNTVDDTCDICFGEFENGEVCVCGCGMKFHRECAELTGECPYCKTKYNAMATRAIIRPVCPGCGEKLDGNICPRCGTVLPNRDMRFQCVCGKTIFAGDGYCDECGAVYEFTYSPSKRK